MFFDLLWKDGGWFPQEKWFHIISHLAFCIASGILLFVTENPGFSVGVCISGGFSLLYHGYLASNVRSVKIANRLAVLDYAMIAVGAAVGIVLELPLPSRVSWEVWVALSISVLIYALGAWSRSRIIHSAWHVASVSPVLLYAILDSGRTSEKLYGELVFPAMLLFMMFTTAVLVSLVWSTSGYCVHA